VTRWERLQEWNSRILGSRARSARLFRMESTPYGADGVVVDDFGASHDPFCREAFHRTGRCICGVVTR
jgi:hypothetical protein